VTLDLNRRIPSATDVTDFLTDSSSIKRDNAIDALIASPEFTDKVDTVFRRSFPEQRQQRAVHAWNPGTRRFFIFT